MTAPGSESGPADTATMSATAVDVDLGALRRDLDARVDGEVRFDAVSRGAYSTDASVYRQVPLGVVTPRTVEALVETVAVCRAHGAPIVPRGGGTSLAGQACGVGVVIDTSRHLTAVESVDVVRRRATVMPGVVLAELNRTLLPHGLQFGPRPSSHRVATIGGMIGNDACGSTAQAYGRTSANIDRLEILTSDGHRGWVGPTSADQLEELVTHDDRWGHLFRGLRSLRDRTADDVAARYPAMPRRVSGYDLTALSGEAGGMGGMRGMRGMGGMDLARLLVGSEGTLAMVLRAELVLVPVPSATAAVVFGYDDLVAAARDVPAMNAHGLHALEGFDARLLIAAGSNAVRSGALPPGDAYLMAALAGTDAAGVGERAYALAADPALRFLGALVVTDPGEQRRLWGVRESGLATTASAAGSGAQEVWPGWEDSAVPPERLADYLAALLELQQRHGYAGASLYGHFGHGCVHTRIPFDLRSDAGIATFRRFLEEAADLVVAHGGSLSGEHGDGRARGELLERMYGPRLVGAFGELKALFDPAGLMNPGKVVAPQPLDTDLRPRRPLREPVLRLALGETFGEAASRCVGVGSCRSDHGGVMCPSYRATRQEEHSTRGRARLLFEMLTEDGVVAREGWQSPAVHEALDLCLGCKGCASDCPAGVDMATYKTEFLHHRYAGRLRPRSHYALGWLPFWLRAALPMAPLVNVVASWAPTAAVAKRLAGVDGRRAIPALGRTAWPVSTPTGPRGSVVLFPDTFTRAFAPEVASAAATVLASAGFGVVVPGEPLCCGLTYSASGQLDRAGRLLRRTARALRPYLDAGMPVLGLEPSCTTALREASRLLPGSPDAAAVAAGTRTLGELLQEHAPDWRPERRLDARLLLQRHCHQYAVLGSVADEALLRRSGADVEVLDDGCCGLAGAFGFERGHYDVSMAVGELALLPRVRAMGAGDLLVADGFSCRTQVVQAVAPLVSGSDRSGSSVRSGPRVLHTAQVLAQTCGPPGDGPR